MDDNVEHALNALQKSIHEGISQKVDVYYVEGKGALVVKHGDPLIPSNIIFALPDDFIRI